MAMRALITMTSMLLTLTAVVGVAPARPASAAASFQAQGDVMDLGVLPTGRPAKVNLWYPRGSCTGSAARFCLADAAATHKVVVLSHGSMGSAAEYSWLGESLASAGFVVVGVNHYGEARIYGTETQNPMSTAFTWQRAQDISALLTALAGAAPFQRSVDWHSAIAIGHSAGGQTVALLAGARYDLRRLAAFCDSQAGKADLSCAYGGNAARAPQAFVTAFDGNYQDTRVKKIVLMDPALGSALRPESLRAIALPSLFAGAVHNDFLPWEHHGSRYASGIPGVRKLLLEGQEGHFVFLTPCVHAAKVLGVPLCADRPGVDRTAVQSAMAQAIVRFVGADDEPATVAPIGSEATRASGIPSNRILQILYFTPRWVFGLLAALVAFGLLESRTRRVPLWPVLLWPAGMLIFSASGVLQYAGSSWPASIAWVIGVSASSALCLKAMRASAASYDAATRRLTIVGSWIPLGVILLIFCVRYAMGVATGMQLDLVGTSAAQLAIGLVLGAVSGFFVARGLFFWRIARVS
jgi:predicted dienelactone hydrolase